MSDNNFTISYTVTQSPQEVFEAINNARGWWSESIKGVTDKEGGVFFHHYGDKHRCTIEVTELIPGRKVAWHILQNDFSFMKDGDELTDTDMVFEITEKDGKTTLTFTHIGLAPTYECYDVCSGGWTDTIYDSLKALITTGKGTPDAA